MMRTGTRFGLRTRLIGLVLVPALVAAALSGVLALERREEATAADEIEDGVESLALLVSAQTELISARIPLEIPRLADGFDIDPSFVLGLLGLDASPPSLVGGEIEQNLRALPADERPFEPAVLVELQASIDAGAIGADLGERMNELQVLLADAIEAELAQLGEQAVRLGNVEIERGLQQLGLITQAHTLAYVRLGALGEHWFTTLAPSVGGEAPLEALADASRSFDDVLLELVDGASPIGAAAIEDVVDVRLDSRFEEAITDALAGRSGPFDDGIDLAAVLSVFQDGFELDDAVLAAVLEVSDQLVAEVSAFAADASRTAVVTLVGALVLVGVLFGASMLVAVGLQRPLTRLIDHTQQVGRGQLSIEPLPVGGPAEIAAASAAFNDVVDNLRLLEGKVQALARCDFEDPRLGQQLPGPLGEALAQSVEVLSGSIVDRTRLQDRLAHQATHDALTGIPNRAAAIDALTTALARAQRNGTMLAVAFIDLDDFKRANDTYGHATGDEILRTTAKRITAHGRTGDHCARLGGDEFVVIAEDLTSPDDAVALARRLVAAIEAPIEIDAHTLRIGASVGIALAQDGSDSPLDLLAKADLGVYRAKRSSDSVELYDETLQAKLRRRAEIEHALRDELDAGGPHLELHYQPIVRTSGETLWGFEALVRWRRGDQLVPPSEFVPTAEASNLVVELDRWVLRTACSQLAAWRRDPELTHVQLAVNVSGRHVLHPDFVDDIRTALEESGLEPSLLTLEVTETVLLDDLALAAEQLSAVRRLGVRVAVDDFGTGYTSLAHLQQLPIDEIKIDGTFVGQLPSQHDQSLIQMVTDLARHIGVPTVAEGVETDEQAGILRSVGCDHLQGFYFATPLRSD